MFYLKHINKRDRFVIDPLFIFCFYVKMLEDNPYSFRIPILFNGDVTFGQVMTDKRRILHG
jgi:hypothetical protein